MKEKNPHAVGLGKLAGQKRLETGGIKVFSEMGRLGAAKRNAIPRPREYYQEMKRKSDEAKRLKKLAIQ